jgi:hypothetical protein
MHKAKSGDLIVCPTCSRIVAKFFTDCADYTKIPCEQFSQPNQPPLIIPPFPKNSTKYGCISCKTELMFLEKNFWRLNAIVRR